MKNTLSEITVVRKNKNKSRKKNLENNLNKLTANNHDFYQMMSENTRDVIFHAHYVPTFGFDYISQSATYITGYTPEEFFTDPLLPQKCILPEDIHLLKDTAPSGNPSILEPVVLRWRRKDDRIIWLEHFISINRNKKGEAETSLIFARDVTERKLADEALQIEKNKLQSVIDAMVDGLTMQDREFNIIFQNEPIRTTSGGDHTGDKCYRVYENRDTVCDGCPVKKAFEDGKPHTSERKRILPSGEITFWEVTANPIRDAGGKVISCIEIDRNITARKKQDQALADEVTRRRILVDQSRDGIVVLDQNGKVYEANRRFAEMLGYSPEEVLKLDVWDWEYQYPPEQVKEMIRTVTEEGDHFETRHRRKDGTTYDVEISTNGAIFAGQKLIFCVCRDITERKKAENELHESQRFNASLLENAPHATVVINPDTSIRYVNPAWERINGWSLAEVIGMKAPYPWWPEELKEAFLEGFLKAMKQETGKGEVIAVKKNGEQYWIDMNWSAVTHDGELQYLLINSVDITERKIAGEKRQAILKTALDGFWICDFEGKFLEVNDSYCNMTGYTQEELLKMSILDVEAIQNPEEINRHIRKIVENGSDRFETQHRCRNGRILDIEISAKYPDIGEEQIIVFIRDITEHKAAEKAVRESEEKFSKAFRSSPDRIVITELEEGKFVDVNDTYLRFTGFSREDVIGRSSIENDSWVIPEQRAEIVRKLKKGGRVVNEEVQLRLKSGEIRTSLFSAELINIKGKPCMISIATDITERKKVEKALRESEEKFSAAFHSSPDMMAIMNIRDGRYIEVNDSFLNSLGYFREEIVGHKARELNILANPEESVRMNHILKEQGYLRQEEYSFLTKSGETRTWLCSVDVISIGGEPSMLWVATDITERKKIQEALRESEEKFSKAFHTSPGSISISRIRDGKFIEVNESFLRDKGYTREEIIGRSSFDLKIWADDDNGMYMMDKLKEGKKFHNEVMHYRTKSGFIRTGLVSAEIINIGNEPCLMVLNNDITQQKQAEEQLRLLSSVTQQVSDSIFITDPKFRITYMNRAAETLFGYTIDEAKGKNLMAFDRTPPTKKRKQEILEAVTQGKMWSKVVPKKRKDGSSIICDCRLSPLYDENDRICSFIDVQRDITVQEEVEAKLKAQKQLIENILATMPEGVLVFDKNDRVILANESIHRILHRNQNAIINKPLRAIIPADQLFNLYTSVKLGQKEKGTLEFRYKTRGVEKIIVCVAIKMDGARTLLTFTDVSREREEEEKLYLTDRLASIGEMAAGLAHELNNPLTGILSLSQLLIDSDIPEEPKEDLQCINSEAKRAASIVKNVLLFTRNNNYENGHASVNEVVQNVLRLREYEEKANNIEIVMNLQGNLPEVTIDKFQLQQVFLNIILNAEAAIKDANRTGLLTITTERENNHIFISFSDNGCGINKHVLPRIFDPFFTTKDIGKGTGLGLSICYGIVVKHGGKISVKTRGKKGTTFIVKMPIVTE
jgi:PAS domain S-box-containing protein